MIIIIPESVLENEIHNLLRYEWITKSRQDDQAKWQSTTTTKKNLPNDGLCCPGRPQGKNKRKQESEKREKYLDVEKTKKNIEHEGGCDTTCGRCSWSNR